MPDWLCLRGNGQFQWCTVVRNGTLEFFVKYWKSNWWLKADVIGPPHKMKLSPYGDLFCTVYARARKICVRLVTFRSPPRSTVILLPPSAVGIAVSQITRHCVVATNTHYKKMCHVAMEGRYCCKGTQLTCLCLTSGEERGNYPKYTQDGQRKSWGWGLREN